MTCRHNARSYCDCHKRKEKCYCRKREEKSNFRDEDKIEDKLTAQQAMEYMILHADEFKFQAKVTKGEDLVLCVMTALATLWLAIMIAFAESNTNNNAVGFVIIVLFSMISGGLATFIGSEFCARQAKADAMLEFCKQGAQKQAAEKRAAEERVATAQSTTAPSESPAPATETDDDDDDCDDCSQQVEILDTKPSVRAKPCSCHD